jgi:hypothetical protein
MGWTGVVMATSDRGGSEKNTAAAGLNSSYYLWS